jgi:hypothetical protein
MVARWGPGGEAPALPGCASPLPYMRAARPRPSLARRLPGKAHWPRRPGGDGRSGLAHAGRRAGRRCGGGPCGLSGAAACGTAPGARSAQGREVPPREPPSPTDLEPRPVQHDHAKTTTMLRPASMCATGQQARLTRREACAEPSSPDPLFPCVRRCAAGVRALSSFSSIALDVGRLATSP